MEALLGARLGVFIGVTVILMGGAAWMTGRAVANTWRPAWQVVAYCILEAAGSRFLIYALFEGRLLSATGFLADAAVLVAIGLVAYRYYHVRRMVEQYPWQYERAGLWAYREKRSFG
ncbi:DUF6867 family protein [Inmirania thermothiophila]|uniref:DUF6867 domain-containing protein n=1 Tax=Inmirania thermothiophila TaxID=1750597 RepID=A0A3N1Y5E6_9GAMM|nr:hypothetical protein [Inmirania thermothiophila]ROR32852.1 hypothetical protein EDC57_2066 [Inmirania thermothiophila]